jgi:hypothetical protein
MILDLFITFVLGIFILYPSLLNSFDTIVGKLLFLIFIYFVSLQNTILGLIAGIIFMFQLIRPNQQSSPKSNEKVSLLPMDETIRPKDSNLIPVDRNNITPPREELSGSILGIFANNTTGFFTQFNL